jgi:hypothetical protein
MLPVVSQFEMKDQHDSKELGDLRVLRQGGQSPWLL